MKRFPTRLVALAAVAALFGFGAAFLVLQTSSPTGSPGLAAPPAPRLLREGQAAPDFALESLDGKTVRLADGKILYFAVDGGVLGVQKNGVRLLTGRVVAADTLEKAQTTLAGLHRKK